MAVEPLPKTGIPTLQGRGLLQVVTPGQVASFQEAVDRKRAEEQDQIDSMGQSEVETNLAGYITHKYDQFKRHRTSANGWSERLLAAIRAFNGQYDATKLAEIRKFGGSE